MTQLGKLIGGAFMALTCTPSLADDLPQAFRDCDICPRMVTVPAGSYLMGTAQEDLSQPFLIPERVAIEQPQHQVTISAPFAIGQTEVTRREFTAFMTETGRADTPCFMYDFDAAKWVDQGSTWREPGFDQDDSHPAICVSWEDAQAYVSWLSDRTGEQYRLPSEAEWEYAARGGTTTLWPWGNDKNATCRYGNVADEAGLEAGIASELGGKFACNDGYVFTAPAEYGEPNPFGLHGMIGNAGEWQQDCLYSNHEGAPDDGSAREKENCTRRVMRGGAWFNPPLYSRPAFRYGTGPDEAYGLVGFRVVRQMTE